MKQTHATQTLLDRLFHREDGYIELRSLPSRRRRFIQPGDYTGIERFIAEQRAEDLYFGVAARKDSSSGQLENCSVARAIFADLDCKLFESPEAAKQSLDRFPLKPSLIVRSGGGFHVYWSLREPIHLATHAAAFRSLLRRTARALGADLLAAEPARVLRLPDTLNFKYSPAREVRIDASADLEYDVSDFEDFLPPEPEPERPHREVQRVRTNANTTHTKKERARKYLAAIPGAVEGNGGDNHTFTTACRLIKDFGLDDADALDLMRDWNSTCRPPWTDAELEQKVANARRYGQNPEGWKLDEDRHVNGNGNGRGPMPVAAEREPDAVEATEPDVDVDPGEESDRPHQYSDDALADKFSGYFAHELRYVPSWGWLEWTGQRWRRTADVRVMERARKICRMVSDICAQDEHVPARTRGGLARAIASAKTVAAVERLARGDARHYAEVQQFDADLWAFNTPGGTIDLKTGELRPHRKEDLITKLSNATPRGSCQNWLNYLDRATAGSIALQEYLQRLAGYSLCGDPIEECIDYFYGVGGNGKGTYLKTLEYAFGEYAKTAGKETFAESRGDKHPCDVADLAGARLVISNEVNEGQYWDESRIKELTGRDTISARFMRQDFFKFVPQFTLIIAGNFKPSLRTVNESIRRRFHLVPFDVVIPPEERNENLKTILQGEADGIMAWAVAGCLEWQRQKLNPPETVLAATAEYLSAEDVFEMWLTECCVKAPFHEERTAFLYESFRRWKHDRGEQPPGQKTFTTRLTERGFQRERDKHGWKMSGLRLETEERQRIETAINEKRRHEGKDEWWNR